jgi:hypothetical protein
MGEMRHAYEIFIRKLKGKRRCGRPSRRWEDNIITGLKKLGWKVCIGCMWLRIVTNGREFLD